MRAFTSNYCHPDKVLSANEAGAIPFLTSLNQLRQNDQFTSVISPCISGYYHETYLFASSPALILQSYHLLYKDRALAAIWEVCNQLN